MTSALPPTDPTVTRVASSATVVTLAAENTDRKLLLIHNASTQTLRIKLGTAASATSFSLPIAAGGLYEMPWVSPMYVSGEVVSQTYAGIVTGIWDSANGYAYVTEVS